MKKLVKNRMDELKNRIEKLESENKRLQATVQYFVFSDRYLFQRDIELFKGRNIRFSGETGTKIGTAPTQKISVYGVTPVAQQAKINDPSGGSTQDLTARATINAIIDTLETFGITASS